MAVWKFHIEVVENDRVEIPDDAVIIGVDPAENEDEENFVIYLTPVKTDSEG
jgi:hypothetical protein